MAACIIVVVKVPTLIVVLSKSMDEINTVLEILQNIPFGLPVLPEVYIIMAGSSGWGGIGSASTSAWLLLEVVFLPRETTSQNEISRTLSL